MSSDDPQQPPSGPPEDAPSGGSAGADLPPPPAGPREDPPSGGAAGADLPPPPPGQGAAPGAGSQAGQPQGGQWQDPGQPQPGYEQQAGYPPQGQWQPAWQQVGVVPQSVGGAFYSPGLVILLMIVTCGFWGAFWTYRNGEDLKKYNGDGLGGVLGVVIYFVLSVVLMFTIPNEIEKMYQREGRESPVSAMWGLWFLLPLIGNFIWYLKVQAALNDFWVSKGAQPA